MCPAFSKIPILNRALFNSGFRLASKCAKKNKKCSGKNANGNGKMKMKCPNSCAARPKRVPGTGGCAKVGAGGAKGSAGKGGGAAGGKKPPTTREPLPGKKPLKAPLYRNLSLAAIVGIIGLSAFVLLGHEHGERPEYVPYPYLRMHNKRFPWGDGEKSLFHNPHLNALQDGYEE